MVLSRRERIAGGQKTALRVFPDERSCLAALDAAGHADDHRWQAIEVGGETVMSFFVWQDPDAADAPSLVSFESSPELAMFLSPAEFVDSLPD